MSTTNSKKPRVEPRPLQLSLNPEDGSLLTAPLSRVLIAATDGLYTDLYNMGHGELEVNTTKNAEDDADNADNNTSGGVKKVKMKMSGMSFTKRRHELSTRLAIHGKAITHVAALTAALHSTELAQATVVSTKALQHARTAWVQADEAQDALYFFHAQLFPARQAPHDVYGALDLLKQGQWKDLPSDLRLVMDRYETSKENFWSSQEVEERWHMAVRDKLIRGEVGKMKRLNTKSLWKVFLSGGIAKLTHGNPKQIGSKAVYPLEAYLTVLSTAVPARWSLLSIEVRAQAKTGEPNHQLDTTIRQRYDLHRICAKAMTMEEERAKKNEGSISHPLDCLFQVAHNFSLSWKLEILSAQAQALRKGVWSTKSTLVVTPVEFFNEGNVLGVVSISFWNVDDRYGPPRMSFLDQDNVTKPNKEGKPPASNQLTLSIQAIENHGIKVSLSGGEKILDRLKDNPTTGLTVDRLLDAASNPFALSSSNALLAATTLCAEQRCHAMVEALQSSNGERLLPPWINLSVEKGSIAVAAQVSYFSNETIQHLPKVVLFRLACDARTGMFVSTFCRSAKLLRLLASNDATASQSVALRMAKLSQNRRRAAAGASSSGRIVRDAFGGLSRSMNVLGTRCGVGGPWLDKDNMSGSLRSRAIQQACADANNSLITCCGMTAVYGLGAIATGVATGISAEPDLSGGPIEKMEDKTFLQIPPLGFVMDQHVVYNNYVTKVGEMRQSSLIERNSFALSCSTDKTGLLLHAFDISTTLDSPSSFPERKNISVIHFCRDDNKPIETDISVDDLSSKKRKLDENFPPVETQDSKFSMGSAMVQLADIIANAVDS
mmetsp:Transcript_31029/g.47322  ORF Transcript_31029/g.47322 Transcript_31029/m.47322 type:complete len:833 (+) Transcript_31029:154-2652(+)|eukprot:CAMPEP_0194249914 /NCGR_PEP_ID=MMETSP0158-20130606/21722_1 /TAXON_ID=33649 /ORGANISM="Thalassionema nitzschioides, Strain L26-B" /LENGTH=832 /DNA_ID=CAMNT_0038986567 /DNA_START=76 /DNA_END=2574 /DNA_ORIENTATION=-